MLNFLDKLGLPVKYAVIGFLIAIVWLVTSRAIGYDTGLSVLSTILAFMLGGYLAGGFARAWAKTADPNISARLRQLRRSTFGNCWPFCPLEISWSFLIEQMRAQPASQSQRLLKAVQEQVPGV